MQNLSNNRKYFILVVGIGILILLGVGLKNRVTLLRQLSQEREVVNTQIAGLEATRAVLQTEIAYATSDTVVEEWAYSEARMIRDGDNLIVPISPYESTPTPSPPVAVNPEEMENWEVWRALFFDATLP